MSVVEAQGDSALRILFFSQTVGRTGAPSDFFLSHQIGRTLEPCPSAPACHFQVRYIHNQRGIKTMFFVVIKTDLILANNSL